MGNSHHLINKTIQLHEQRDPYRNLWRNVLIVAIEDLMRKKETHFKFNIKKYSLEEMWFHHEDFEQICEWAQFEPKIIRKRIYEAISKMENKYKKTKNNLSEVQGKWFYKTNEINRSTSTNNGTMSTV
jgi:flagellar biosynthesis regulator FlbT